jgi:hypothetical protein
MTKKKRKSKEEKPAESFEHKVQNAFKRINIDNRSGNESAEDQADLAETASAESGAGTSGSESRDVSPAQTIEPSDEVSVDDLLDDVRRSLIEDEAQAEDKKPGWLSRIAKGFQKDETAVSSPVESESEPLAQDVPTVSQPEDQYLDEIDQLIDMLEPEVSLEEPKPEAIPVEEPAPLPEPEPRVDVEELKKRVFSPREGAEPQEVSEVRSVAFEGGEDVFVEVQSTKEDASQERMKAFENSLRPYRQYIYFAIGFLGIVLAVAAVGIMYTAYQRTRPPEPTPVVSNLPHPTAMSLPGGLNFNLGRGSITDGKWNPSGPEWLQGTEICRWVAIPWSKQLEAVVRTLTPDDSIELVMSNNDRLTYDVFSIQELTLEEMQALDQNSPCLLLVLAEQDAEQRWVVTAKP